MDNYLIHYACQEFENFRKSELKALSVIKKVPVNESTLNSHDWKSPFLVHEFSCRDLLHKLIASSVLIKAGYHIWCSADSFDQLITQVS